MSVVIKEITLKTFSLSGDILCSESVSDFSLLSQEKFSVCLLKQLDWIKGEISLSVRLN